MSSSISPSRSSTISSMLMTSSGLRRNRSAMLTSGSSDTLCVSFHETPHISVGVGGLRVALGVEAFGEVDQDLRHLVSLIVAEDFDECVGDAVARVSAVPTERDHEVDFLVGELRRYDGDDFGLDLHVTLLYDRSRNPRIAVWGSG